MSRFPGIDGSSFPDEPTYYAQEAGYCVASWTNILINVVSGDVTAQMLKTTLFAHKRIHVDYPSGIGVYTTLLGMPPIPEGPIRKMASESIQSTAGEVLAQVSVIEMGGFWGSAARSAMATINMLARAPNPTKVVANDSQGVGWIGQYMSIGNEGGWERGLVAAIGHAKQQIVPTATTAG